MKIFYILALLATVSTLATLAFGDRLVAGCNPCVCGAGGGLPPPPQCSGRSPGQAPT